MKTITTISRTIILMALAITFSISKVLAAKELIISSGGETGNYYGMTQDIIDYCASEIPENLTLTNLSSGGSTANIFNINNKKAAGGWVQEDDLQYRAKRDPNRINRNRLKVVAGMHIETVHILIPKDYKPSNDSGGLMARFNAWRNSSDEPKALSVDMLKDQTVGAWGGSVVSAEALGYFLGLNLQIQSVDKEKAASSGLPLVIVGGQPYKPVEEILSSGKYEMVGVDFNQISTKAPFYVKVDANYPINGKVKTVPTFGVRALLIGKAFRKESRNAAFNKLSECITSNLGDLADDYNTNPNWGAVFDMFDDGQQSNWSHFHLN